MSGIEPAVVIVQMRLDSSRLPRKALLPLGGVTLAEAVMRRLSRIRADGYILASDDDGARELGPRARSLGFDVVAGPKDDVLARYILAVRYSHASLIVRATGDNPLVSYELAASLMARSMSSGADYSGYVGMPVGMGVEVVRAEALLKADGEATSTYDREHVCPYLYERPDSFRVDRPECPESWYMPGGRVTVDTPEDYDRVCRLVADLGRDPTDAAVMSWLADEDGSRT
ncbi:MAG: acylneuraminate cytidylyltransferase [Spirochaetales bacterium]|nr:MAG: acylneuraminate cytidylyltransferase [Spirochaetales bacterium]